MLKILSISLERGIWPIAPSASHLDNSGILEYSLPSSSISNAAAFTPLALGLLRKLPSLWAEKWLTIVRTIERIGNIESSDRCADSGAKQI